MGHLSTHVLDTMNGCPAAGMTVELLRQDGEALTPLKVVQLNADGRHDGGPLLDAHALTVGRYRLVFHVAAYFRARGASLPEPASWTPCPWTSALPMPGRSTTSPFW